MESEGENSFKTTHGNEVRTVTHTLTRESHDVRGTNIVSVLYLMLKIFGPAKIWITWVDIPHCGQLNSTTSTLLTPR